MPAKPPPKMLQPNQMDAQTRFVLTAMKQSVSRLQMTSMTGQLPAGDVVDVLNQMATAIAYAIQRA